MPIQLALMAAYGVTIIHVASAAWLWFEWTRSANGALTYRWRL